MRTLRKFSLFLLISSLLGVGMVGAEEIKGLGPPSLPIIAPDTIGGVPCTRYGDLIIPGLPNVAYDSPERPSLVSLTSPSLPEVLREEPDRWGLPPLSAIKLSPVDPAKTIEYQTADFSGGVSSVFSVKPANMADASMNMLPDSVPGMNARKGYDRLTSTNTGVCYGLAVMDSFIVEQIGDSTVVMKSSNSYSPALIVYYKYDKSVGTDRSRVQTFFTSAENGLIVSNGEEEPYFLNGFWAEDMGTIKMTAIKDTISIGVDSCKLNVGSQGWTADQWIDYIVHIRRRDDDTVWYRIIIDSDDSTLSVTQFKPNIDNKEYECRIVGMPDKGEVLDSCQNTGLGSGTWWGMAFDDNTDDSLTNIYYAEENHSELPVFLEIIKGKGQGQIRHIRYRKTLATPPNREALYIEPPWEVRPDSSSYAITYQKYMPRGNNGVIANDYYISSGGEPFRNRVYVSAQGNFGDFGAMPEGYISAPGDVNYFLNLGGNVWVFGDDWIGRLISASNLHVFVKNVGCPFPHTIAVWGSDVYWLANNGVWTTAGSGNYYQEGAAGLSKISAPIDDKLKDLRRRAKHAGAGFDGTGKYWLSISTDADTIPDETFVWDTKTKSWWPQETFAFSYYAFSEYPGDTSGFIFARKDSGYVFKYGAAKDAEAAITYWWRRILDDQPMNEKNARSVWFYGTLTGTLYAKLYENDAVVESLTWIGTGLEQKYDYWTQSGQCERIGFELKTTDTDVVVRATGFEYEDLGRRPK